MNNTAELKNVTKTFGEITALENVNLDIREGEILALLGPNGSGKSTLLRILALIENATKGEIYFRDIKVNNQNTEKIRMETTMVFQRSTLFSTNVYNNVAYGLKIRKTPKNRTAERISRILKLTRLEGFEKRQCKQLSGGEQQRVALARALVLNTKLLLLDEPTANLDPKNASIIEEIIATANRENKTTIVIATHNMFQARNLPHRIGLIANGKLGEVGTPTEIFGTLSKTLASFAALDNIFTGTAKITANDTSTVDIGNGVQLKTTAMRSGAVSVFVSPKDIILSRNRFESSARNTFKGKIVEISDSDSVIKLKVDVGKSFAVQITKRSFNEMKLNLNTELHLTFKASSVQIV
jgi:tungstate transport system ATP-binding protein